MYQTSLKGVLELCEHEGIVPAPYRDSQGYWTWGVGHTAAAGGLNPKKMRRGMPANLDQAIDQAIDLLVEDLQKYEKRVNMAIGVPLKPYEFDALTLFDYNTGGIFQAKLTDAINNGDENASKHFFGWMKPPEIRKRRRAEERLFRTGDYDHNGDEIPVWGVDDKGNLTGVIDTLSGDEVLKRFKRAETARQAPTPPQDFNWFLNLMKAIFG